ncbi:hypothetical protein C8Q80DRAFT_1098039 [Daedaleopsis nitida]|nr:hypothetical protein C8Q80DRAFT_1098039 [Daedaleopsis nitida]
MSLFQQRLADADLPPPGPDHFAARRALWWAPSPNPPAPAEANPSRRRLEALLSSPGAIEDDQVWEVGVDRVWRGLIGGAKLKHRLPLALILKILQAGWIREGTWPKGAIVPDSDDDLDETLPQISNAPALLSTTTPEPTTPDAVEAEGTPKMTPRTDLAEQTR